MLTLVDYHKMMNNMHNHFVYKLSLESMNTILQFQTYQINIVKMDIFLSYILKVKSNKVLA